MAEKQKTEKQKVIRTLTPTKQYVLVYILLRIKESSNWLLLFCLLFFLPWSECALRVRFDFSECASWSHNSPSWFDTFRTPRALSIKLYTELRPRFRHEITDHPRQALDPCYSLVVYRSAFTIITWSVFGEKSAFHTRSCLFSPLLLPFFFRRKRRRARHACRLFTRVSVKPHRLPVYRDILVNHGARGGRGEGGRVNLDLHNAYNNMCHATIRGPLWPHAAQSASQCASPRLCKSAGQHVMT